MRLLKGITNDFDWLKEYALFFIFIFIFSFLFLIYKLLINSMLDECDNVKMVSAKPG